jgi:hypothetical protein
MLTLLHTPRLAFQPLQAPQAPAAPLPATTPPALADAFTLTPPTATTTALRVGGKPNTAQLSADTLHHTLNAIFEALSMDLQATHSIIPVLTNPVQQRHTLAVRPKSSCTQQDLQGMPTLETRATITHPKQWNQQPPLTPQEALGIFQALFTKELGFPTDVVKRVKTLTPNTVIKAVNNSNYLLNDRAPRPEKLVRSRRTRKLDDTTFLGVLPEAKGRNGQPLSSSTDRDGVYGISFFGQGAEGGIPVGSSQSELGGYSQRP